MKRPREIGTALPLAARCVGYGLLILPSLAVEPIPVGYYGPADAGHPVGGTIWQGTRLAMEEAEADGLPAVRLVQAWDENPWSGGAAGVVRMAYHERVAAILASVNGDATHLAEQVVSKARLPMMDPGSTDPSVNAAFVPWVYSVMPDDRALMGSLAGDLGARRFVLVSGVDHDSRTMAKEFFGSPGRRRPDFHLQFSRAGHEMVERVAAARPENVVVLAGAVQTAEAVRLLRSALPGVRIWGGHPVGRRTFLTAAGGAAEGVRFPLPCAPADSFVRRFRARFGHDPDYAAAYGYDAARLLILALRRAGRDGETLRDAILALSPYDGVSGRIQWSKLGRNIAWPRMAVIEGGLVRPVGEVRASAPGQ